MRTAGTRRLRRRERGSAALELAIIAPALLLLIFFSIQAGLYFYGRTAAVQAAREGVAQLRLVEDTADYEQVRPGVVSYTRDFAGGVGGQGLVGPEVTTRYDDLEGRVWVTVTGSTISLVPGLELTASAEASGTTERFRAPEPAN